MNLQMKEDAPEVLKEILDKGTVTWTDILATVDMDESKADRFMAFLTREGHVGRP